MPSNNTVTVVGTDKTADFETLRALVRSYGMLGVARMLTHVNGIGGGKVKDGTPRAVAAKAEKAIKTALRGVIQNGEFRHVRAVSQGEQDVSGDESAA